MGDRVTDSARRLDGSHRALAEHHHRQHHPAHGGTAGGLDLQRQKRARPGEELLRVENLSRQRQAPDVMSPVHPRRRDRRSGGTDRRGTHRTVPCDLRSGRARFRPHHCARSPSCHDHRTQDAVAAGIALGHRGPAARQVWRAAADRVQRDDGECLNRISRLRSSRSCSRKGDYSRKHRPAPDSVLIRTVNWPAG